MKRHLTFFIPTIFKSKLFLTVMAFSFFTALFISKAESSEMSQSLSPVVLYDVKHDITPLLLLMTPVEPKAFETIREIPIFPVTKKLPYTPLKERRVDPVLQYWHDIINMPATIQNFDGVNNRNGVYPPDPNGDVGPNHYVQMVNLSFAIWNKTGTLLYGPANNNTLWSGFGGPCATRNDGDPIVLYDRQADRWLMSQFALPGGASGYHQCIAISQTADPTGAWYRYDFLISATKMNDYPKFGVWPDAYYMSVNQFIGSAWAGAGAVAFERSRMLQGLSARLIYFDLYSVDPNLGGMLPSHLNGPNMPPLGAPNYFVQFDDDAWGYPQDQLEVWQFHVDWATPANSTFTTPALIATAAFDSNMCGYARNCIPQPGTAVKVDALSDLLMYRLNYRNSGAFQSMVVNHTVDVDGTDHAGVRWYELRKTGGGWTMYQQGTYAPDSAHRWMGSIAKDGVGNIALGYSISDDTSIFPSIQYAGRLAGDTLGTLPQAEATLMAGAGSQTGSAGRWGDYSSMSIDPIDECTFWYTQEYLQTTGGAPWKTRIGSFRFPECTILKGKVVDALFSKPIPTAQINLTPPGSTTANSIGIYQFLNPTPGSYDITASAHRFTPGAATGVSVVTGSTTVQDFALGCSVSFNDVPPGAFAENYIETMYCRDITSGCTVSPLNYCPNNNVLRAQMAVFIIKAMGQTTSAAAYNAYFDDIANDGFAPYINRMKELGIASGCGTRLYCPNNNVLRAQMAVFIISAMKQTPLAAGEAPSTAAYNAYFDDIANDGFAPYINRMKELGITSGCGTRLYCPNNNVTRSQMAVFIISAF